MTKIKAAIKLYENKDGAMNIVREFEERAETLALDEKMDLHQICPAQI